MLLLLATFILNAFLFKFSYFHICSLIPFDICENSDYSCYVWQQQLLLLVVLTFFAFRLPPYLALVYKKNLYIS